MYIRVAEQLGCKKRGSPYRIQSRQILVETTYDRVEDWVGLERDTVPAARKIIAWQLFSFGLNRDRKRQSKLGEAGHGVGCRQRGRI